MMGFGNYGNESNMMGFGSFGLIHTVLFVVVLVDLVLLGIWLWKQIQKK